MSDTHPSAGGVAAALGAFGLWGLLPLYFHLIGPSVSPWEILVQRVIWAAVLLALVLAAAGRWTRVRAVLAQPHLRRPLMASTVLIVANWGVFIWAVTNGHVLESSLGYYINPLLNVFLGFAFLGERLRRWQMLAVGVAAAGVILRVIAFGSVPWIALVLAGCFGGYGLIRKQLAVDSATGLFLETLMALPAALIGLAWMYAEGRAQLFIASPVIDVLLIGAGAATVVPLVLFTAAAQRLRLATLGLFQYITPTMHLLTGVLVLGEPFTGADGVTFAAIWTGLAVYTADTWSAQRAARRRLQPSSASSR
ncbi:Protein RarD [wastewater metagenome]|uniref:Protein RarD n=2 Tax=unclassified sequences TaxID=12908 RepID=A0A5B8R676_9ZZZZ|nr:protein RarD [uncultured organism]